MPSIKVKINLINNSKQQLFTFRPINIISNSINALGLTSTIEALTAKILLIQVSLIPAYLIEVSIA